MPKWFGRGREDDVPREWRGALETVLTPLDGTSKGLAARAAAIRVLCEHMGDVPGDLTMRLSEVPAILLSEAWNDLRLMAADGPGFDPDWAKKVEY
jgi:hypothetical protein